MAVSNSQVASGFTSHGEKQGPCPSIPSKGAPLFDGSLGSTVLPGLEGTALEASGLSLGRFPTWETRTRLQLELVTKQERPSPVPKTIPPRHTGK